MSKNYRTPAALESEAAVAAARAPKRPTDAELVALLPCPFCGSLPIIEPWHGGVKSKRRVGCENESCAVAPTVCGDTETIARERWNTRADALEAANAEPFEAKVEDVEELAHGVNVGGPLVTLNKGTARRILATLRAAGVEG